MIVQGPRPRGELGALATLCTPHKGVNEQDVADDTARNPVQGRTAEVLSFPTEHGEKVTLAPPAFVASLDRIPGIESSQLVQTVPTSFRVRLRLTRAACGKGCTLRSGRCSPGTGSSKSRSSARRNSRSSPSVASSPFPTSPGEPA